MDLTIKPTLDYDGSLPSSQTLSGEVAATTSLTYNNDFQLSAATTAGAQTTFTYDADGLRTSAGDLSLTNDAQNGLLGALSLANTTTRILRNPYGEPEAIHTDISGSNLYRINLTRDAAGRITTKQEIRPSATTTWAYNYDAAGRLVNVLKDGAQYAAYTYDANSNRTSKTIAGSSTYATFDARDRMKTQGDLDLTYNDNGEMVSRRDRTTGDELALEYTTLGDLKTAQTPDGEQIEYLLDAAGRRVGKKVDGQLTQGLIYSPEAYGPVAELDQNNDLVARFVYGRGSNVPDYMQKGSTTYRLITDQLGSVVMVVDATTGAIAQEIQYGPFGEVLADSNPGFQPFGFAGGIYDGDTGLVHFGAREYDAELGRWSASDPIGFGGGDSNLYGYVLGDPVNLVDPSGLDIGSMLQYGANAVVCANNVFFCEGSRAMAKELDATFRFCGTASFHVGAGGSGQVCYNVAPDGSAVSFTTGAGVGVDAGLNGVWATNNSNSLCDLVGDTVTGSGNAGPFGVTVSDGEVGMTGGPEVPAGGAVDKTKTVIPGLKCECDE